MGQRELLPAVQHARAGAGWGPLGAQYPRQVCPRGIEGPCAAVCLRYQCCPLPQRWLHEQVRASGASTETEEPGCSSLGVEQGFTSRKLCASPASAGSRQPPSRGWLCCTWLTGPNGAAGPPPGLGVAAPPALPLRGEVPAGPEVLPGWKVKPFPLSSWAGTQPAWDPLCPLGS